MVFGEAEAFTKVLQSISKEHKGKGQKDPKALPLLPDLRMAMAVAAADLRPLIVLYAPKSKRLAAQTKLLEAAAWNEGVIGRMRYVILTDETDLAGFEELELKPGISVVQPEPYGRSGIVLTHLANGKKEKDVLKSLTDGLKKLSITDRNVRDHVRKGKRQGITWEAALDKPEKHSGGDGRK